MSNFQKKNNFRSFVQSKPVLIFLAVLLIIFIWNIFGLISKMQEARKNKKIEEEKIVDLENRKERLLSYIEKLNTEKGKEEIIRENFGMVREGEEVIVIVEDQKENESKNNKKENIFVVLFKKIFRNN